MVAPPPDQITYDYLKGRPMAPSGQMWDEAVAAWRQLPRYEGEGEGERGEGASGKEVIMRGQPSALTFPYPMPPPLPSPPLPSAQRPGCQVRQGGDSARRGYRAHCDMGHLATGMRAEREGGRGAEDYVEDQGQQ